MLKDIPTDAVGAALREAAALDVMPRFQALAAHEIREKKPGDLVTVADEEAEHRLTASLSGIVPGSLVVGEEAHAKAPDILDRLESNEIVWLIDPIDGTKNFTEGNDLFCMMVAAVYKGETVKSWIYDPVRDRMAIAGKGEGAFLDDKRLKVAESSNFSDMVGQVNFGVFPERRRHHLRDLYHATFREVSRLRCAGHDFLAQSLGERNFALYNRLWSWDHVPGVLLLREAGGYVARLDGQPYRPQDRVMTLLSAPGKSAWDDLYELFNAERTI